MKRLFFFSLLFLVGVGCIAQKQNNIWYFGIRAGMDFNAGSPVPLTDSKMYSFEGCATMSDAAGNLLFYTNAGPHLGYPDTVTAVWNKNHQVMPNGNLDTSGGCWSASQGALIVPNPANADQYYLFTMDCQENLHVGGLRYSIIDMTLDGGLGDVTLKGIQLTDSTNEKMCGIKHANGTDYWVIMHKGYTNSYLAYQITNSGIQLPIVTSIGAVSNQFSGGTLKANRNGNKICHSAGPVTPMLFDFDDNSGVLSNYIQLNGISMDSEFSPNCRFLYLCNHSSNKIFQYDLNAGNIPASAVEIADSVYQGRMQLGPDGKIYKTQEWSNLDVINAPDQPFPFCAYQEDGFYLGGRFTQYSLPNMINGLYGPCLPPEGIEENNTDVTIDIYPNPTTGQFTVSSKQGAKVEVYDLFGRLVLSTNKQQIDMSSYPAGLYIWSIGSSRGKLILE